MTNWLREQLPQMEEALAALVELNSFSTNRDGCQRVASKLEEIFAIEGLTCQRVPGRDFGDHLVFRSEGEGAPIALLGHLDTVFPPGTFEGYRVDGALRRGPGVLDMKGGLIVIAWALKALVRERALPPMRIVIVSDEEVGSPEGAPLIREVITGCSAALVFESGRANDAIVTERKGTGSATVTATGKAAHAGNAYWDGANAIWALSRFVDSVQKLSKKDEGVTVNVGTMSGGTAKNTVAENATAGLDLRFPTLAASESLWKQLHEAASAHGVEGARVMVAPGPGRAPMEKQPGTAALMARYAASAKEQGLGYAEAPRQGGGSDGNTSSSLGIPTIDALGPRGRFFHTSDEYIEVDTLISRAAALADFLKQS